MKDKYDKKYISSLNNYDLCYLFKLVSGECAKRILNTCCPSCILQWLVKKDYVSILSNMEMLAKYELNSNKNIELKICDFNLN